MVVVDRGLCVTSGAIGLKLVCWRKVDVLNTEYDADYDMNISHMNITTYGHRYR